jgi:hypothetical protein
VNLLGQRDSELALTLQQPALMIVRPMTRPSASKRST